MPEVLGSSPSAGVAGAGRVTAVGFGVTLDTAAGEGVTPTEGSSGLVAAVGSSFTGRNHTREINSDLCSHLLDFSLKVITWYLIILPRMYLVTAKSFAKRNFGN